MIKAMDSLPGNLSLITAKTYVSHWWHQEGRLARIASLLRKKCHLIVGEIRALECRTLKVFLLTTISG